MTSFSFWRQPKGLWMKNSAHVLACVGNQVRARLQRQTVRLKPLLELGGAGEHADARAVPQPVPCFLAHNAGAVLAAVLENGGRRDPQLVDLDAALALILESMLEPEEICGTAAVIVVK